MHGRMIVHIWVIKLLVELRANIHPLHTTVFKGAHSHMTNKQSKIRQGLEESMSVIPRALRFRWMRPLYHKIFVHAILLLFVKHNHKLGFGDYVFDRCGCILQRTHGLPCTCRMYIYENAKVKYIYLDGIHPCWKF